MTERSDMQFFSIRGKTLYYFDKPLVSSPLLQETFDVESKTKIERMTTEAAYLTLIFVIASQRESFERPVRLVRELRDYSLDRITDPNFVNRTAVKNGIRWASAENRYSPAFHYMEQNGGIDTVVNQFLSSQYETRRILVEEVQWLAHKTASFWYFCLGGKELVTLDVHNFRQIAGLGINIPDSYYIPQPQKTPRKQVPTGETETLSLGFSVKTLTPRKKPRKDLESPSGKKYERIEAEIIDLARRTINLDNGREVDGSFLTTLFWITGAKLRRRIQLHQSTSIVDEPPLIFDSPFK